MPAIDHSSQSKSMPGKKYVKLWYNIQFVKCKWLTEKKPDDNVTLLYMLYQGYYYYIEGKYKLLPYLHIFY